MLLLGCHSPSDFCRLWDEPRVTPPAWQASSPATTTTPRSGLQKAPPALLLLASLSARGNRRSTLWSLPPTPRYGHGAPRRAELRASVRTKPRPERREGGNDHLHPGGLPRATPPLSGRMRGCQSAVPPPFFRPIGRHRSLQSSQCTLFLI